MTVALAAACADDELAAVRALGASVSSVAMLEERLKAMQQWLSPETRFGKLDFPIPKNKTWFGKLGGPQKAWPQARRR